MHCFRPGRPRLPGDYREAISHMVTGATPIGWTPLHCLCHGSDKAMVKRYIIEALLESEIATVKDFDQLHADTPEVIVFLSLGAYASQCLFRATPPTLFEALSWVLCVCSVGPW